MLSILKLQVGNLWNLACVTRLIRFKDTQPNWYYNHILDSLVYTAAHYLI